jgi:hypothetical protein
VFPSLSLSLSLVLALSLSFPPPKTQLAPESKQSLRRWAAAFYFAQRERKRERIERERREGRGAEREECRESVVECVRELRALQASLGPFWSAAAAGGGRYWERDRKRERERKRE